MANGQSALLNDLSICLDKGRQLLNRSVVVYEACKDHPPTSYGIINTKRCEVDLAAFKDEVDSINEKLYAIQLDDTSMFARVRLTNLKLLALQQDIRSALSDLQKVVTQPKQRYE